MSHSPGCPHQGVCSTVPADAHFRAVAELSGLAALRVLTLNHHNLGIEQLPETLGEAIEVTAESELVLRTLGEHMFNRYV